jgi:hypothetical protein
MALPPHPHHPPTTKAQKYLPWTMRPFSPDKLGGESGTGTETLVGGALLKKEAMNEGKGVLLSPAVHVLCVSRVSEASARRWRFSRSFATNETEFSRTSASFSLIRLSAPHLDWVVRVPIYTHAVRVAALQLLHTCSGIAVGNCGGWLLLRT